MTARTASGAPPQSAVRSVELTVEGMACGACAARVERALRRYDGVVDAGVNFATSRARVAFDSGVTGGDALVALIASLGYEAAPVPSDEPPAAAMTRQEMGGAGWLVRAGLAWLLTVPIIALPALRTTRSGQILAV